MSSQYLNQSVKNQNVNIHVNDAVVQNSLTTNDLSVNNFLFKKHTVINQASGATSSVDATYKVNLIINTQTFTTPHSTNNSTSFIITNYDVTGSAGDVVNVSIQKYSGSTGLPMVSGVISNSNNNQYTVNIINLHHNENLNGTFRLAVELSFFT